MIGNPGDRAEAEGLEGEQDGEQEKQARSSSSEQSGQVRYFCFLQIILEEQHIVITDN